MKRIRNITILIFLSTITQYACKLHKKQQSQQKLEQASEQQTVAYRRHLYSGSLDSNQRHWSLWTDGWLHYHPDSGLRAQGGHFSIHERAYRRQSHEQEEEAIQARATEQQRMQKKETSLRSKRSDIKFWVIISLVLIPLYFAFKMFKRK